MIITDLKSQQIKRMILDLLIDEHPPVSIEHTDGDIKFVNEIQQIRWCIFGVSVEVNGDTIRIKDITAGMNYYPEVTNRYFLIAILENLLFRRMFNKKDEILIVQKRRQNNAKFKPGLS